jgi:argininosuccinate lyase
MTSKLWGGRFSSQTDPVMEKFNESINFDKKMWAEDIDGSKAYARALGRCGIISEDELMTILGGLDVVYQEWQYSRFELKPGDEDIHTANERRLTELIGEIGGKLHTGRSRNDQVATDVRLWLRKECTDCMANLLDVVNIACDQALEYLDVLQPGFTHLQPAQVIRYSHWLMSHVVPLVRDMERLKELQKRVNVCPLGSGALAGHAFGIDRSFLALQLGFQGYSFNSLDATCDRDPIAEYMQWASLFLVHISQFAEDVIILNALKGVTISDAYSTGSSLLPQKKNPDALELLRGKAGRVLGNSTGFMCTLKGLPRAYNKDLQEDKEALFDTVQTVTDCIAILSGVMATMKPNEAILRSLLVPEMLATDIAEYLVRKGVPFRETHHIAGAAVKLSEDRGVALNQLTYADFKTLHGAFDSDIDNIWSYEVSAESRNSPGGTAKAFVFAQINAVRDSASSIAGL